MNTQYPPKDSQGNIRTAKNNLTYGALIALSTGTMNMSAASTPLLDETKKTIVVKEDNKREGNNDIYQLTGDTLPLTPPIQNNSFCGTEETHEHVRPFRTPRSSCIRDTLRLLITYLDDTAIPDSIKNSIEKDLNMMFAPTGIKFKIYHHIISVEMGKILDRASPEGGLDRRGTGATRNIAHALSGKGNPTTGTLNTAQEIQQIKQYFGKITAEVQSDIIQIVYGKKRGGEISMAMGSINENTYGKDYYINGISTLYEKGVVLNESLKKAATTLSIIMAHEVGHLLGCPHTTFKFPTGIDSLTKKEVSLTTIMNAAGSYRTGTFHFTHNGKKDRVFTKDGQVVLNHPLDNAEPSYDDITNIKAKREKLKAYYPERCNTLSSNPEDIHIPEIHIYPNPSSGLFTLKNPFSGDADIEINAINGLNVYSGKIYALSEKNIELNVNSGLYIMKITSGNQSIQKKLIITN